MSFLTAQSVSFSYDAVPTLVDIDLELERGTLRALIGPNGSGKTTLLKLLTGILKPSRGQVLLEQTDLQTIPRRELARHLAFVPQEVHINFGFTVRQMVMLGRTPYVGAMSGPSRRDRETVESTMQLTDLLPFAERLVTELSGGEQQRVVIAMALAQEPDVLLLDEPTVHLDLNHQVEILELVRRLNRERGLTVLATMHDLNLAALYFDDLVLLEQGRIVARGSAQQVLSPERIRQVFNANVLVAPHPARSDKPQVIILPETQDRASSKNS